jgi:hypothetical protein
VAIPQGFRKLQEIATSGFALLAMTVQWSFYEKNHAFSHSLLSAQDFSGFTGEMPILSHLLQLRLRSDPKIRGLQGRLACFQAAAAVSPFLQGPLV